VKVEELPAWNKSVSVSTRKTSLLDQDSVRIPLLRTQQKAQPRDESTKPVGVQTPLFVVVPSSGWIPFKFGSLWEYRELLYFLVWRDVKVRYKQAALGGLWVVLQPFLTMIAFTILFGNLGQLPSEGMPYPIFVYTALLPWQLFAGSLAASSESLLRDQQLITKVYFPRLLVPFSTTFVRVVDFSISFVILVAMMAYYGMYPSVTVLFAPFLLLLAIAASIAVGTWLAALNVQYRDEQHTIPFLVQFLLFVTPVAYSSSLVPPEWRLLYSLNPMVGVVDGFRWAFSGQSTSPYISILMSIIVTSVLLLGGLIYFRRAERTFADVV
jgi:lipopolysaccharide transport system permease protein